MPLGSQKPDRSQRAVQSVEVGGRLLLVLADSEEDLALKDLAELAGMTASRAHPYLVSYGRLGLVEQDPQTGRYELGPAALRIGLACIRRLDPLRAAESIAKELAISTGHAIALAVWGNFGPTVIRLFEARKALQVALRVGSVLSVLETATGKAFAAALPEESVRQAIEDTMGAAERTQSAKRLKLLHEVRAEVQRHGLARAMGKPIPGVNAFSAAVLDHQGKPALVITATDHEDRLPSDWNTPTALAVKLAAARITERLGG